MHKTYTTPPSFEIKKKKKLKEKEVLNIEYAINDIVIFLSFRDKQYPSRILIFIFHKTLPREFNYTSFHIILTCLAYNA